MAALAFCVAGAAFGQSAAPAAPKSFDTPDAAAQALIDAAANGDTAAMMAIFGPGARSFLSSGDTKQDQEERAEFARLARAKMQLEPDPMNHDRVVLAIGTEDWPFPVPIIRVNGKWSFDSSQGNAEVRARRVGANELNVVEICAGYVEAQQEFAARNAHGMHAYAQRIMSSAGNNDGLYADGASPAQLVPRRFAEAAVDTGSGAKAKPYHGYYYRILKAQGSDAPGGAHNYIVKASTRQNPAQKTAAPGAPEMLGGFAFIAWPAQYGVSGVHTFIVNEDGVIFEKDLGSTAAASLITRFNPDHTWTRVQ
jgi:hypothetical protein